MAFGTCKHEPSRYNTQLYDTTTAVGHTTVLYESSSSLIEFEKGADMTKIGCGQIVMLLIYHDVIAGRALLVRLLYYCCCTCTINTVLLSARRNVHVTLWHYCHFSTGGYGAPKLLLYCPARRRLKRGKCQDSLVRSTYRRMAPRGETIVVDDVAAKSVRSSSGLSRTSHPGSLWRRRFQRLNRRGRYRVRECCRLPN